MRHHWRALVALVIVALSIRLAALASDPHPGELAGLSGPSGEVARNILVHGRWFVVNANAPTASMPTAEGERPAQLGGREHRLVDPAEIDYTRADAHPQFVPYRIQMPGPALLLAAIWRLTGPQRYLPLQLLQALLDALAVLLVYWISRRLYGRDRAALLAAAGYALFVPLAMLMTIPFYDPWAVLLTIASFALFLWSLDTPSPGRRLLAMGATVGAGLWFRPALAILPLALAVALVPSMGWRRAARHGLVPLMVALVIVAPYSLWTLSDRGQFTPVSVGVGQVLWEGLGERPNSFGAVLNDDVTFEQVHRERPKLAYATPAYDSYLRHKAVRAIAADPGYYLGLLGRRVVSAAIPLGQRGRLERAKAALDPAGDRPVTGLVRRGPELATALLAAAAGPLLLTLAVIGLASTWRHSRREHALLLAVAGATFAVPVLLLVEWRYVAPATFVYLVLGGVALDRAMTAVLKRPRRGVESERGRGNGDATGGEDVGGHTEGDRDPIG